MCGANVKPWESFTMWVGSSPRVRGEPAEAGRGGDGERIIPACAGRTPRARTPTPTAWDHPRVCGANLTGLKPGETTTGSSPRVRGERHHRQGKPSHLRIIPACAGRTRRRWGPRRS